MIELYHESILDGLRRTDEVVRNSVPEAWSAEHAQLGKSLSSCFYSLCWLTRPITRFPLRFISPISSLRFVPTWALNYFLTPQLVDWKRMEGNEWLGEGNTGWALTNWVLAKTTLQKTQAELILYMREVVYPQTLRKVQDRMAYEHRLESEPQEPISWLKYARYEIS